MENLFIGISKYMFTILMAFYVFLSFIVLQDKNHKSHKSAYNLQVAITFIIHLMGNVIIYMNSPKDYVVIFYGVQVIFFVIFRGLFNVFYEKTYNKSIINNMCMLLTISFIMLSRLSYNKSIKQFAIVFVASIAALIIPTIICKMKTLVNISYIYCFAGIAFLAAVLIIGQLSYGAKLSIEILGFSFQPSEFVKILYVFFIGSVLNKGQSFKYVLVSGLFAGLHVIILVLSKDLGSALIFFIVYIMMIYVATGKFIYFAGGLIAGSGAAVIAYKLFSHVQTRVLAFIDPWKFIDSGGYQVTQSLFAIGTGGVLGLGLFRGMPRTIPVVEQDFIFSAISEELGGLFAISLILLYLCCFISFIRISMKQNIMFYKLVGLGLSITFVVQTILTIGGAIKFIPSTGVTLPLISYGGSSVLCTIIIFSIIQGLSIRTNNINADNSHKDIKTSKNSKMNY